MTSLDAGLAVRAFFTSREGGVSEGPYVSLNASSSVGDDPESVAENRRIIARLAGVPVVYMAQSHGSVVGFVGDADANPQADAIVTATRGLALAVTVADCVPILAHDRASGAVAAIHAGRRGIQSGIVTSAIAALRAVGRGEADIEASVGPAICGECYEVPEAMRDEVSAVVPEARATTAWGTTSLDLPAAARAQLVRAGVSSIVLAGGCTRERPEYFSHRRDGVTGRFVGVIVAGART